MVVDPILRFNWIFYMIHAHELQTSSLVAFLIALSEVLRRGLWTLFRVENEHCNNVGRFRASRDVPLPYDVEDEDTQEILNKTTEDIAQTSGAVHTSQQSPVPGRPRTSQTMPLEHVGEDGTTTATDIEHGYSAESAASFRHRHPSLTNSPIARALRQAGNTMRSAHAKDYERKRKPDNQNAAADAVKDDDDDDDDVSSDSDDDTGRQQPRGPRQHVERERRNSSEDGLGDLAEAEDLVSRARSGNK